MSLFALLACVHSPREPGPRSHLYTTEVTIEATPDEVWAVLVDFDAYEEWNPMVPAASGSPIVGERLPVKVILDGKEKDFTHVVTLVDEPNRFCWRDAGPQTTVAFGQRCRRLTAVPEGTLYQVELLIEGPMKGTVDRRYGVMMQTKIEDEASALKARLEDP